jgi:hypothetical protein
MVVEEGAKRGGMRYEGKKYEMWGYRVIRS